MRYISQRAGRLSSTHSAVLYGGLTAEGHTRAVNQPARQNALYHEFRCHYGGGGAPPPPNNRLGRLGLSLTPRLHLGVPLKDSFLTFFVGRQGGEVGLTTVWVDLGCHCGGGPPPDNNSLPFMSLFF